MRFVWFCGLTLVVAGCAVDPQRDFVAVQSAIEARTGQRAMWRTGAAEEEQAARAFETILSRELSADDAVAAAFLGNRRLQAVFEGVGIAEADLVQAGLLRNPVFSFEVLMPGRPHVSVGAGLEMALLDVILLPLRKQTAEARFEQAKAQVVDAVLTRAANVRESYYRAVGSQQLLELQSHVVEALALGAEMTSKRREAGNVTALEVDREEASLWEARLELEAMKAQAEDDRAELAKEMGAGAGVSLMLPVHLPELPGELPDVEQLVARAVEMRADLAVAKHEVELAGRAAGYANWEAMFEGGSIGLQYERDADVASMLGPSISVPIPIFDQGQAASLRAQVTLRQAKHNYAALLAEIRADVRKEYNRMTAQQKRAAHLRTSVIPLHKRIGDQMQLLYNGMFIGLNDLLLAKQAEIEAGRGYVESMRDYWVARSKLEAAVGGRLQTAEATTQPATRPAASMPNAHIHSK